MSKYQSQIGKFENAHRSLQGRMQPPIRNQNSNPYCSTYTSIGSSVGMATILTNVVRDALVHLLHHLLETVLLASSHGNKLSLITAYL